MLAARPRRQLGPEPTQTIGTLRNRAIFELYMATPATIAWIAAMRVQDFYRIGGQAWVRIVTDGVERIEPVDRVLEAYLDEYIAAAGIGHDPGSRLFRYFRGGKISPLRVTPRYISDLIKRHARSGLAQGRQR